MLFGRITVLYFTARKHQDRPCRPGSPECVGWEQTVGESIDDQRKLNDEVHNLWEQKAAFWDERLEAGTYSAAC